MNKWLLRLIPLTAFSMLITVLSFSTASAAEIFVNSTAHEAPQIVPQGGTWVNGNCTLGEAIQAVSTHQAVDACSAGSNAEPNVIHLQENTLYSLTSPWSNENTTNGLPEIQSVEGLVIEGHGATIERAVDAPPFRLLYITGVGISRSTLTLRNVTLANGNVPNDKGGAIRYFGMLTIENSIFRDNSAQSGGAIYSENGNPYDQGVNAIGSLTIRHSTFTNNSATRNGGALFIAGNGTIEAGNFTNNRAAERRRSGGAIHHENGVTPYRNNRGRWNKGIQGILRIEGSFFSENQAPFGSAVFNRGIANPDYSNHGMSMPYLGKLLISRSTLLNNRGGKTIENAGEAFIFNSAILNNTGGGINNLGERVALGGRNFVAAAYLSLANSTVSGNSVDLYGGGVRSGNMDAGLIINSTITGNTAANDGSDGLHVGNKALRIQNSIIAGNGESECVSPPQQITSLGNNIFGNLGNCVVKRAAGDQIGVDPRLGILTGNEDEVRGNEYFPLLENSPAINAGKAQVCIHSAKIPNLDKDQIGKKREGICEIGSSEVVSVVLHWSFDQVQDGLIPDMSGNNKNGRVSGAEPAADVLAPGVQGNALLCDGANNFVRTPQEVEVGVRERWTISWWQNLNHVGETQHILTMGGPAPDPEHNPPSYLDFIVNNGGGVSMNYIGQDGAADGMSSEAGTLFNGEWQYIAITNSGGNALDDIKFYVNGVQKPLQGAAQHSLQGEQSRFIMVCRQLNVNRYYVNGKIDELIIRNRAFSAQEVMAECQSGAQAARIACGGQ